MRSLWLKIPVMILLIPIAAFGIVYETLAVMWIRWKLRNEKRKFIHVVTFAIEDNPQAQRDFIIAAALYFKEQGLIERKHYVLRRGKADERIYRFADYNTAVLFAITMRG